ncbi:transcription factor bHLH113 isoform X1 [Ziziphus jujuba]|uniref:Transcription factor bHLH113 isoform X1 n=2 Tax=Ziziphus jujuba TaxID=326968 RepID=A0A6P6GFF4_ZIZJJ|nr:transcription factor bHLH113 isoform X1 [Ziziphus jujuba]
MTEASVVFSFEGGLLMAENDGFDRDHLAVTAGTNFSQLLFADDDSSVVGLDVNQSFNFASSSAFSAAEKPPKMLCFGNYQYNEDLVFSDTTRTSQKSGVTCSDSSSTSSSNRLSVNTLSKPNQKKRNGWDQESVQSTSAMTTYVMASQKTSKRTKTENPTTTIPAKRKEKLGERIAALQQLVSPFGKTDTASVLHEAMGYIKFLQDQVQVLCSPYLQRLASLPESEGGENGDGGKARKELRSRGLCLVPVECTVHVANDNGADFWSPAMSNDVVSLSTKQ